jgi:hypothetical protein
VIRTLACLAALPIVSTASLWGAVAFTNGSFETPAGPLAMVTTGFTGWTVTAGDASLLVGSGANSAADGSQYLFLPGSAVQNSVIEQTLTGFVTDVEYEIGYSICGFNPSASAQECDIEIAVFNHKADSFTFAVPSTTTLIGSPENPWQRRTFTFLAEGPSSAVSVQNYRSSAANDAYVTLDAFTIRVVPKGRPSIVLSGKPPRRPVKTSTYQLRGRVTTTLPVERIDVVAGKTKLSPPTAATFIAKVHLKKGRNRIAVRATDIAGTSSASATRVIIRE